MLHSNDTKTPSVHHSKSGGGFHRLAEFCVVTTQPKPPPVSFFALALSTFVVSQDRVLVLISQDRTRDAGAHRLRWGSLPFESWVVPAGLTILAKHRYVLRNIRTEPRTIL